MPPPLNHTLSKRACSVRVFGNVQGVCFRALLKKTAQQLNLFGWVHNEPDGSVQCFVQGKPECIESFIAACHEGPRSAKVDHVEIADVPYQTKIKDFTIQYTVNL